MSSDFPELTEKARNAAQSLKALAHETRLLALCHLSDGKKSVAELEKLLGTSQSNISQHLAKMRDRGLVDFTKEGNQVFYFVKNSRVLNFIQSLQETFC